jgi:hypothetical protein
MKKMAGIGRNEPCPCGSGKKFKQCCDGKDAMKANTRTKWAAMILGSLVLLGTFALVSAMWNTEPSAQPMKVWSPEHGHYH